jgi:hypothetical protein
MLAGTGPSIIIVQQEKTDPWSFALLAATLNKR